MTFFPIDCEDSPANSRAATLRSGASPWYGLEGWKHAPAEVKAQIRTDEAPCGLRLSP
jgi:hypothetical protein